MTKGQKKQLAMALACILPGLVFANKPYYGATASIPTVKSEPADLQGYQLMLSYDPQSIQWRKFNIYFDGGFSHFSTNSDQNSNINIYSIAPVVRYSFNQKGPFLPFLELSIGLSYLNKTKFNDRNLGIHFAFQDRLGVGALVGQDNQLTFGVHAVHYSNANLSKHNAGITIPLVLDIGYRFQ